VSSNSREAILAAARSAAQAHGYSGLNFRDLAEGVGIKSASIYYYFPSKEAIVAALADNELQHFKARADGIGIDCLVEVHDETELGRALDAGADFIGINNRNLATFDIDLNVTERLAPKVPGKCTIVSESGIRTTEDIRRVIAAGAHAALIGEALMRATDPRALLESFLTIAEKAK